MSYFTLFLCHYLMMVPPRFDSHMVFNPLSTHPVVSMVQPDPPITESFLGSPALKTPLHLAQVETSSSRSFFDFILDIFRRISESIQSWVSGATEQPEEPLDFSTDSGVNAAADLDQASATLDVETTPDLDVSEETLPDSAETDLEPVAEIEIEYPPQPSAKASEIPAPEEAEAIMDTSEGSASTETRIVSLDESQRLAIIEAESLQLKPTQLPQHPVISPDVLKLNLASTDALNREPTLDPKTFQPQTGARFNPDGTLTLRVLVGNTNEELTVIGDFNLWGAVDNIADYKLHPTAQDAMIHTVTLPPDQYHLAQYRLVDQYGNQRLDIGSALFSTPAFNRRFYQGERQYERYLNSVFWQSTPLSERAPRPDLRGQQLSILETEMVMLAVNWECSNADSKYFGQQGGDVISELYNFVTECRVPEAIADLGYNAIQFMPLDAHIDYYDPDKAEYPDWRYSYQTFSFYTKQADFGSPDELRAMINAFHQAEVAVILDTVFSHYAEKGNNPPREFSQVGFSRYKRQDQSDLYGASRTEWQTRRLRYSPEIRRNLVEAALVDILDYGFDGIRVDNINGIDFEAYGRDFLRETAQAFLAYEPKAVIIGEGYFGDPYLNRALRVGGAGLTTTYSDRFYLWFTEQLLKHQREIDTWKLDYMLMNDWPRELLYYPGNHDEFANAGNPFQARGLYLSQAVDGGDFHNRKLQSWSAMALFASSYYLDMFQMWTLQPGSLSTNAAIQWDQLHYPAIQNLVDFQADMKHFFIEEPAFAPYNQHRHMVRWMDHENKVILFEKIDFTTGKRVYVVVNLADQTIANYRIHLHPEDATYAIALDSDRAKYGGQNRNPVHLTSKGHWLSFYLDAYGVVGFVQEDNIEPVSWTDEGDLPLDDLSGTARYYTPPRTSYPFRN